MNQLSGPIGDLARTLTYQDFPNHFVILSDTNNAQSKLWHPWQWNTFALGQMTYVRPTAGEWFHLWMLLMIVKGATSFDALKTVDGEIRKTFHDACYESYL